MAWVGGWVGPWLIIWELEVTPCSLQPDHTLDDQLNLLLLITKSNWSWCVCWWQKWGRTFSNTIKYDFSFVCHQWGTPEICSKNLGWPDIHFVGSFWQWVLCLGWSIWRDQSDVTPFSHQCCHLSNCNSLKVHFILETLLLPPKKDPLGPYAVLHSTHRVSAETICL